MLGLPTGVRKKNAASSNSQHLVNTTPHSSITIGNRVVKREEILNLTLMNLKTLLKEAQPQVPTSGWNKERAIRALWDIHSAENDGVLARQMELFCKLIPSATDRPTLDAALPFIYQYRRHFASVDRLDQFLAYLDTNIRTTRDFSCVASQTRTLGFAKIFAEKVGERLILILNLLQSGAQQSWSTFFQLLDPVWSFNRQ